MSNDTPTETITFSALSNSDKIKYFNYFLSNNISFTKEPKTSTYIAEIQIMEPIPQPKPHQHLKPTLKPTNKRQQTALIQPAYTSTSPAKKLPSKSISPSKAQTKREYEITYAKVLKVTNPIITGNKGSKVDISILRYLIEEIYSLKFLKDTQTLSKETNAETESFPVFVGKLLISKYPKKSQLDQQTVNILSSVEFYAKTYKDVKLFSMFLTEEYDNDDLIFYLFVRSCIEKELKMFFLEKAKEKVKKGNSNVMDDIYVPVKACQNIALAIFGNDEPELLNAFIDKVAHLTSTESLNKKKTHIKAVSILAFAVEDYHVNKDNDDNDNDSNNNSNNGDNGVDMVNDNDNEIKTINNTNNNVNHSSTPMKDFKTFVTKHKADKAKSEVEKRNAFKKIVNDYIKEREIHNYINKLLRSNPAFTVLVNDTAQMYKKALDNIKDITLKKLTLLVNYVFTRDKGNFLSLLKLKENDIKRAKTFVILCETLDKVCKNPKFCNDLSESNVMSFINGILDIPEFNILTSKLILKNIE